MEFEIGSETVLSYKRLSYKAWYAIAEFVDNSTQSYFDHSSELDDTYSKEGGGLEVSITYDSRERVLRVVDNAYGMSEADLDRAVKVGKKPDNTAGRSEFGMGLKTAACWFGDSWQITTKLLGDEYELSVSIDVAAIASGQMTLDVKRVKKDSDLHYTILEIRRLHNKINGWGVRNIQECLGSIYRQDLRAGTLTLLFNDAPVVPPFTVTEDSFLKRQDGSAVRVPVSTVVSGKAVGGYMGVLAPGSASRRHAGFAVVRRGRCVQGWYDAWRPEDIFGAGGRNDLINQRLTGELTMDEFAASHTKDSIVWSDDDESELIDYLKELATAHELIHIARTHRGADSTAYSADDVQAVITRLGHELSRPEVVDAISIDEVPPPELRALLSQPLEELGEREDAQIRVQVGDGVVIEIFFVDGHHNDPYYSYYVHEFLTLRVLINQSHPAFAELPSTDAIESHAKHCAFDAIAEWKCRMKTGAIQPDSVKIMKDTYFRSTAAVAREAE